jgi:MFS family permease
MDIRMFGRRDVATVLTATSIVTGIVYAYSGTMLALLTLYPTIPGVSGGLGWSVMHSALIGLPAGLLLFVVGIAVGSTARRLNPLRPWLLGVVLVIVGIVLQGLYHDDETQLIATGLVAALGIGMVYASAPVLVLRSVSREEQALASGMSLMLVGLMVTVGTQVIFTVLNHDSSVLQGVALYHGNGYRNAFFALAGCIGVGLVISLLIPKLRTVDTEE